MGIFITPAHLFAHLYLSKYEDWIDPRSITGVIYYMYSMPRLEKHNEVLGRPRNYWRKDGFFLVMQLCIPGKTERELGKLGSIPLPDFFDPGGHWWTLNPKPSYPIWVQVNPFKLVCIMIFSFSMKPFTGSRIPQLQWFMPIHVLREFFSGIYEVHKTPIFWVIRQPTNRVFSSFDGWWVGHQIHNWSWHCEMQSCVEDTWSWPVLHGYVVKCIHERPGFWKFLGNVERRGIDITNVLYFQGRVCVCGLVGFLNFRVRVMVWFFFSYTRVPSARVWYVI